jgi:hypothetical protein
VRKLLSLLQGLPAEGALARAQRGHDWTTDQELAALTVDRLGGIDYLLRAAHFKGTPDKPKPIPRPGVAEDGDGTIWMDDPADIEAYGSGPG